MQFRALIFSFAILVSVGASPSSFAQDYAVIDFGHQTVARAVNELGWATGAKGLSAFVWRNGVFEMRPRDGGGCCSFGFGINDLGEVAGQHGDAFFERAGLWLDDGTLIDIGTLGGTSSEAWDVNNQQAVAGCSKIQPSGQRGFIWENGTFTVVPPLVPDGADSCLLAINELGQATGAADYDNQTHAEAILWDNGQLIALGLLQEGRQSQGSDINNHTQIVGFGNYILHLYHAFLWEDGQMIDINDDSLANSTFALAINDDEVIVGSMLTRGTYLDLACIWRNRQLSDLNESLPVNSQWTLIEAWDINNFGQVVGNGKYRGQNNHGFMLTPVTPTMALEQPSPGRADAINTLTVTGCDPGKRVYFTYSRRGGGTIIPGCDLQENALQFDQPTVIGSTIADENGRASITKFVPGNARNLGDILIQALQQNGCKISQMVAEEFE